MSVAAIIQARMNSTRLPGKVMFLAAGKPLLQYQLERAAHSKLIKEIIVATTNRNEDDEIVNLCGRLAVKYFRGSEADVLDRFYQCAKQFGLKTIVRLTADNPLQEPGIVDKVISAFLESNCDYASNTLKPTYPDGLDVEVFTAEALEKAWLQAKPAYEREHVTPFLKENPVIFKLMNVEDEIDHSGLRCTVDTLKDYILVKDIIDKLYSIKPYFTYADILRCFGIENGKRIYPD